MVLDAAFSSIDDDSSMAVYTKILGVGSQPIMAELTPLLHKSVFNGTLKSSKIKELMADLCEIGVKSWLPSSSASLVEAPNVQWLKSYLGKEATSGIYQAFSQDDRVWSIYTYFVWKPVIEKSREALRWALDLLVHLIDDDKEAEEEARAEGMYIQLELEANPEGWTPLHRACAFGRTQTVKNLIASMSTDKEGLEDRDNESYTPLHLAAKAGHAEIVRILLEAGARVNAEDNLGYTALMYSAGSGLEGSDHERAVVLLLEGGANIDHHAHDGYTALLWASASGLEESVKFLIKSGADLEARDNVSPLLVCAYNVLMTNQIASLFSLLD